MQNIGSFIKNRRARESDHYEREHAAQTETENNARKDKGEGDKSADRKNRTEKRKVFARQKNRRRQTEK